MKARHLSSSLRGMPYVAPSAKQFSTANDATGVVTLQESEDALIAICDAHTAVAVGRTDGAHCQILIETNRGLDADLPGGPQ